MYVEWIEKFKNVAVQDRIRGSLIGGAAGDALGYAVEFMSLTEIDRVYQGCIQSYHLDSFSGEALISDDTQMTLFTANGILRGETLKKMEGSRKPSSVFIYEAYLDWLRTQGMESVDSARKEGFGSWLLEAGKLHNRRAPGGTCLGALRSGKQGSIAQPLNDSCGCGGVMRVAPVGLYRGDLSGEEVMLEAAEAAAITHGHPMGYIPAGVLAFMIHRIVFGGVIDLYKIVSEAQELLPTVFGENAMSERMVNYLGLAAMISRNESEADWPNIARLGEGWVGDEALAIAVYCCLRYPHDFSKCIAAAVNHDGDSDSTGAIAGNILGALHGYESIDMKWKEKLELHDVILEMADDLYSGVPESDDDERMKTWLKKYKEGKRV